MRQDNFLKMNELLADVAEIKTPVNIDEGYACHIHVIQLDTGSLKCERLRTYIIIGYEKAESFCFLRL